MVQRARFFEKLKQHELFADVDISMLTAVLDGEVEFETYSRGELLLSGESFRSAIGFFLQGGAVLVKREGSVPLYRLREGDVFGAETLFFDASRVIGELRATGISQVAYLSKNAVLRLMQLDSGFALSWIRFLSAHTLALEKRILRYTGGTAESRLASFLLDAFADYKTFELDRSMQQLASLLDTSRASLYRAFDHLTQVGAIGREGKSIRLANKELLCTYIHP